jgi:hypothetical protein
MLIGAIVPRQFEQSVLTIDEIISLIKHSDLPTILVEGPSDVTIVKKWQDKFKAYVSILPTYGRPSLLKIYLRKHEFEDKKVIFLADKDMWRFDDVPSLYSEIIFTEGYCIENDIFADNNIIDLLDSGEKVSFERLIEIIGRWFARQLELHRNRNETICETHINEVCDFNIYDICQTYRNKHNYIEPNLSSINEVMNDFKLNIRGKQLFQALAKFTNSPGRLTKYNESNLIELALRYEKNKFINNLIFKLDTKLWN